MRLERDFCLIQVLARCYILQRLCRNENARGETGNNSRSADGRLAQSLIKITNHTSSQESVVPVGLSLQTLPLWSAGEGEWGGGGGVSGGGQMWFSHPLLIKE